MALASWQWLFVCFGFLHVINAYSRSLQSSTEGSFNWKPSSPTTASSYYYYCVAMDATGTYITAAVTGSAGYIEYSKDGGSTWSKSSAATGQWQSVASDSSGVNVISGLYGNGISQQ